MKEKYQKILDTLNGICSELSESYGDQRLRSELIDCKCICRNEILRIELKDLGYNNINKNTSINSANCFVIGSNVHYHKNMILWLSTCSISWPDSEEMKLEVGKYYVMISFSVGPYCIIKNYEHNSDNYDKALPLFMEMWNEILAYKPTASDSHNKSAWFEIHSDGAVRIWNDIDGIIDRYSKRFDQLIKDDKELQIKMLEEQIERLKAE